MANCVNLVATQYYTPTTRLHTFFFFPARPVNAANAECEGRQHTHGSKRSYMSSPFVEKTGNARKKRCVTGSAGNAFVMCYLCSTKVVNETVNPKCLTIECLIGIGMKLSACYEACL